MYTQRNSLIIACILLLFVFNFSYSIKLSAQDSKTEFDESIEDTALDLDGNFSYAETVDSDMLNTLSEQVTVSVWIKATDFPNRYASVVYKGDPRTPDISNRSYAIFLRDDGAIQFASSPRGLEEQYIFSPSEAIKLNKWHHIAGVVDTQRNFIKVFIDGFEVGRTSFRGQQRFYESLLPLRIGNSHEDDRETHSSFVGQIDEVSIWNIALTDNQIRTCMKKQLVGDEKGLVGYWKFDEQTDGIVSDISSNQNDAFLIGDVKLIRYIRPFSAFAGPGQLQEAATVYEKALTRDTNSYEIYRSLAEIYIRTGRLSDAEKIYLRALEADLTQSEHDDAIQVLHKFSVVNGTKEEFIILLEKLRPKMEESAILHQLLGDAYKNAGEEEEAKIAYSQWLKIRKKEVDRKNDASVYYDLAIELLEKNMFPEMALEFAFKATEGPSSTDYIITLVQAFLVNEQYENAYQLIESIFDMMFLPYVERDLLSQVVKTGKNVKDKEGYVEMLNKLIDSMPDNLRSQLSTTLALAQFYKENDQDEKANALIRKTGFITEDAWMILGPFDNVGGIGFNTAYIPENLPKIDLTAKYDGINGKVSWQKSKDDNLYGHIHLGGDIDWCVAYAFATVNSPDEREVEFRFDSDDQGKIWLNGIEVFSHTKTFTAEIDNYIIPVTLQPGKNSILVKVCEETQGWGFYLRITDTEGKPFNDLKIVDLNEN
ncbi:MAG: tetratricopeptide repeat protein [Candidatus Poribacteria bacterium]|nr:tetratricopeptide repeat protein [Candidatus Poribacteria bacterium]